MHSVKNVLTSFWKFTSELVKADFVPFSTGKTMDFNGCFDDSTPLLKCAIILQSIL